MLSILTFNLRYANAADGINTFDNRIGIIQDCLHQEMPDIIGFQEMTDSMLDTMRGVLPDYTFIGNGRNADHHGEHNSIAYRTGRFTLYSSGTFWLSSTPANAGSRFDGQGSIPRICTWAVMEYLPDRILIAHYNTHLDHEFERIRKMQMDVIQTHMAHTKLRDNIPIFLSGDFNMEPEDSLYQDIIQSERFPLVDVTIDVPTSFHGFGKATPKKIDYVFTDPQTAQGVFSIKQIRKTLGEVYLSDHDAILVEWEL